MLYFSMKHSFNMMKNSHGIKSHKNSILGESQFAKNCVCYKYKLFETFSTKVYLKPTLTWVVKVLNKGCPPDRLL